MSAHWSDAQIEAATARGDALMATEPRARAARYDAAADRIVIDLVNGASFAFPPWLAQGLRGASPADLAEVEVAGVGFGCTGSASTPTSRYAACLKAGSARARG